MAAWWRAAEAFPDVLKILLRMVAETPNPVHAAKVEWGALCKQRGWEKMAGTTALQLFNPAQGKGTNSPKAEWRSPGNLKGFWLLEWLKAVGFYQGAITRIVANPKEPRNAKDRKSYVLIPKRLDWGTHVRVMRRFQEATAISTTAVKLDILTTLGYTETLLRHYDEARTEDLEAEIFGRRASDVVSGTQMAFYKNLGQSTAVMNIATLSLPRWVAPRSREDLARLQGALAEHGIIVRSLDETRGKAYSLLRYYRDFLSANDLQPFFEFTNAYSGFIMSQMEKRQYVRPFTTTTLEVLFMNSDDSQQTFSQIVRNEGFRNVAYAIRHSTVVPQSRRGRTGKASVDVRYGLGQQLIRKAAYP
ncbi:MAG: hypothetical protein ACRDIB_14555, partial [Ardenticatenaceae bacterium]